MRLPNTQAAQTRERDAVRLRDIQTALQAEIESLREQVAAERRERTAATTALERQHAMAHADTETREAQHAHSLKQLLASHASAIEVLRKQRNQEVCVCINCAPVASGVDYVCE